MIFRIMSSSSIPHSSVELVIRAFSDFVDVITWTIEIVLNAVVDEASNDSSLLRLRKPVEDELFAAKISLKAVNTTYKLKKVFENHTKYVAPIPIEFSLRDETRLYGSSLINTTAKNVGYLFIPISKTIASLLSSFK